MVIDASGNYDGTTVEMMCHMYVIRGGTILQESRAYSIVGNLDVWLWTCAWLWQQAGRCRPGLSRYSTVQYLVAKS